MVNSFAVLPRLRVCSDALPDFKHANKKLCVFADLLYDAPAEKGANQVFASISKAAVEVHNTAVRRPGESSSSAAPAHSTDFCSASGINCDPDALGLDAALVNEKGASAAAIKQATALIRADRKQRRKEEEKAARSKSKRKRDGDQQHAAPAAVANAGAAAPAPAAGVARLPHAAAAQQTAPLPAALGLPAQQAAPAVQAAPPPRVAADQLELPAQQAAPAVPAAPPAAPQPRVDRLEIPVQQAAPAVLAAPQPAAPALGAQPALADAAAEEGGDASTDSEDDGEEKKSKRRFTAETARRKFVQAELIDMLCNGL